MKSGNPFPGPRPYQSDESERFFGREADERRLENLVVNHRAITLYGPTGCGKSSLVRAKVFHALEKRKLRVFRIDFWPMDEPPLDWLVDEMFRKDENKDEDKWQDLRAAVPRGAGGEARLAKALDELAMRSSAGVLIFLDQFEELLRPGRLRKDGKEVLLGLATAFQRAITRDDIPVKLLIGLREDYLGLFRHRLRNHGVLIAESYRLSRLSREKILDAAQKAAERGSPPQPIWRDAAFSSALDGAMQAVQFDKTEKESDAEIEAPFAQIILQKVWNDQAAGKPVMSSEGKIDAEQMLRAYLDEVLSDLAAKEELRQSMGLSQEALHERARELLEKLVDDNGNRQLQEVSADLKPIVEELKKASVLRSEPRENNKEYFQLGHDLLAAKVNEWKKERKRQEQETRQLEEKERDWKVRASRLQRNWIIAGGTIVVAALGAFSWSALQSRDEATLQAMRAGLAKLEALRAERRAQKAKQQVNDKALLFGAESLLDEGRTADAALLLREWQELTPEDHAAWQLHAIGATSPVRLATLRGHQEPIDVGAWSPDGKIVATGGKDGIRIWNADGRGDVFAVSNATDVTSLIFNAKGDRLLACSKDGKWVGVWSVNGATREAKELKRYSCDAPVLACVFDTEEKHVITIAVDGRIEERDVESGAEREVGRFSMAPSEKLIHASFDQKAVRIAGVTTKSEAVRIARAAINSEAVRFAALTSTSALVFDRNRGETESVDARSIAEALLSPDGQLLYVLDRGGAGSLYERKAAPSNAASPRPGSRPPGRAQGAIEEAAWQRVARVASASPSSLGRPNKSVAFWTSGSTKIIEERRSGAVFSVEVSAPRIEEESVKRRVVSRLLLPPMENRVKLLGIAPSEDRCLLASSGVIRSSPGWEKTTVGVIAAHHKPWDRRAVWSTADESDLAVSEVSEDGRRAIVRKWQTRDETIFYDVQTGKVIGSVPHTEDEDSTSYNLVMNGRFFMAHNYAGLRLFDPREGPPPKELWSFSASDLYHVRVSPDGKLVAYMTERQGKKLVLCEPSNTKGNAQAKGNVPAKGNAEAKGKAKENAPAKELADAACRSIDLSEALSTIDYTSDGKGIVVAGGEESFYFVDIASAKVVSRHKQGEWVRTVDFDDQMRWMLTSSSSGLSKLWRIENGRPAEKESATLMHKAEAEFAAFSPDGKKLATVTGDIVWLWSLDDLRAPPALYQHVSRPVGLHFDPAGKALVLVDDDGVRDEVALGQFGVEALREKLGRSTDCLSTELREKYTADNREAARKKYEACERSFGRTPPLPPPPPAHSASAAPSASSADRRPGDVDPAEEGQRRHGNPPTHEMPDPAEPE